jgi:hypothetical protein
LHCEALFNKVHVDLSADLHALLVLRLVVRLSTSGFDVLLDGVDLALVLDQFLLDIVKTLVNITLHDLIFLSIMLHRVVSHLSLQTVLVLVQELLDVGHPNFFPFQTPP